MPSLREDIASEFLFERTRPQAGHTQSHKTLAPMTYPFALCLLIHRQGESFIVSRTVCIFIISFTGQIIQTMRDEVIEKYGPLKSH